MTTMDDIRARMCVEINAADFASGEVMVATRDDVARLLEVVDAVIAISNKFQADITGMEDVGQTGPIADEAMSKIDDALAPLAGAE